MNIPIEKRIDIEKQIVTCIVDTALAKGYRISVYSDEDCPIARSTDKAAREASAYCERTLKEDGLIPLNKAHYLLDSQNSYNVLDVADFVR